MENPESCLNCGQALGGRFCAHCGQDSKIRNRSVGALIREGFEMLTDLDGRIWTTMRVLLFQPGTLTRLYLEGKRQRFLAPLQLYAVFSFVFFLAAFYLPDAAGLNFMEGLQAGMKDDVEFSTDGSSLTFSEGADSTRKKAAPGVDSLKAATKKSKEPLYFNGKPVSLRYYDSVQQRLPETERNGWLSDRVARRYIAFMEKINSEEGEDMVPKIIATFQNAIPNLIILLLPFFALGLKLVYLRRRMYWVDHFLFSVHLHVFGFILFSIWLITCSISEDCEAWFFYFFFVLMGYLTLAFRTFYAQGWFRTAFKLLLVSGFYITSLGLGLLFTIILTPLLVEP